MNKCLGRGVVLMDKYPNNLRKIRLSQKNKELRSGNKIAELLEVTPQYYYKLETGREGKRLNIEHLRKLSKIFNITSDEILGGYSPLNADFRQVFSSIPEISEKLQREDIALAKYLINKYNHLSLVNAMVTRFGIPEADAWGIIDAVASLDKLQIEEQTRVNNCLFTAAQIIDPELLNIMKNIPHDINSQTTGMTFAGYIANQQDAKNIYEKIAIPPGEIPYIPTRTKLPIIGTVTAGPNGLAYSEPLGEEWTDEEDINNGAKYYWLQVKGDSMIGEGIIPGDLALVREQPDIESGDLAIVIVDGEEGTLKRVYKKENSIVLQSANAAYPPRIFAGPELKIIRIAGKVKVTKRKY